MPKIVCFFPTLELFDSMVLHLAQKRIHIKLFEVNLKTVAVGGVIFSFHLFTFHSSGSNSYSGSDDSGSTFAYCCTSIELSKTLLLTVTVLENCQLSAPGSLIMSNDHFSAIYNLNE